MTGKELIANYHNYYDNPNKIPQRNSMGCSENWYDPIFCIYETFSENEILSMNEETIDNMIKLADKIGEGLY